MKNKYGSFLSKTLKCKKAVALFVSAVMILSCTVTAVAAENSSQLGAAAKSVSQKSANPAEVIFNKDVCDTYSGAYNEIVNGLKSVKGSIDISKYNVKTSDVSALYHGAVMSNPELFYVNTSFSYSYSGNSVYRITASYSADTAEIKRMTTRFNNEADRVLSLVDDSMSDAEKAVVIHDELALSCSYSTNDLTKANAYDALVDGSAVCQGYSLAYSYLLSLSGIKTELVESSSMNHMWNRVLIDGSWYNVDLTWDDPVYDRPGHVSHKYFLLSDSEIQSISKPHYGYSAYYSANSKKYDKYLVHEFNTRLCNLSGRYYAVSGSSYSYSIVRYNLDTDAVKVIKKLDFRWSAGGNSYWVGIFSSLEAKDGLLYYNSDKSIYSYDIGANRQTTFVENALGDNAASGESCYGFVFRNDNVYSSVSATPNNTGRFVLVKSGEKAAVAVGVIDYVDVGDNSNQFVMYGDVDCNGIINIIDATLVQKVVVGISRLTSVETIIADVNDDGKITITDSTKILRYIVGL